MPHTLVVLLVLAFGSLIPSAISDKWSHNKNLRFLSFLLFTILVIVRLLSPLTDLLTMMAMAFSYAAIAAMQLWVWTRLNKEA